MSTSWSQEQKVPWFHKTVSKSSQHQTAVKLLTSFLKKKKSVHYLAPQDVSSSTTRE